MLFASFLASKWRWLLLALAIIFAVLLLTQAGDYASTWWAHRQAAKAVRTSQQAADGRAAAEPAARHDFDSTVFSLIGQHRELRLQEAQSKKQDEALTRRLPAAPALPADPPRQ